MVGYLKVAGLTAQCTRCFSLRNLLEESKECPTCKSLLNETHTETQSLPLADVCDDAPVLSQFSALIVDRQALASAAKLVN